MKQEPHIIYLITKLELGGAQKVCLSIFNGNSSATLITGTEGALVSQVKDNPNVILMKELTREVRFFGLFAELQCFIKLVKTLRSIKKKHHHVLIHTHSTKAGLLGRWAAFFAGIKKRVHTIHGYAFHDHQNRIAWSIIYTLEWITSLITTHFVCVSSADVKTGIELFPGFAKKHSIIRAAVDPSLHPPFHAGYSGQAHIGTANKFTPAKYIFSPTSQYKNNRIIFGHVPRQAQDDRKRDRLSCPKDSDSTVRPERAKDTGGIIFEPFASLAPRKLGPGTSLEAVHTEHANVSGRTVTIKPHMVIDTNGPTPFIFGTIACFKPQKNLFDLLQAFEYVYRQNPLARLEIIGDGQLRPALEAWIFEHKLHKVITLHGWQEHVGLIMMHWHAFVLSSLWEGLPCAIVEARLQKLPVISYNTGGIHDVIFHGENGLLYPQKEWQKLAGGMLEVASDKKMYAKLRDYEDQLDDFKISTMVEEHKKLYSEL